MARVRLALTISGAVALGAFEGGVLAALINAIRPLAQGDDADVVLDAIGGASAGSMTGLVAARCLTGGYDPVPMMQEAWVSGDSIQRLLHNSGDSPLSAGELHTLAGTLFRDDAPKADGYQETPVRVAMTLACLRGLQYTTKEPNGPDISATTYVDLVTFDIGPDWRAAKFLEPDQSSPADVAIASGANEMAFPPQLLAREAARADYAARGLALPVGGYLWYTDGGTIDNEPLGHTLDLTNDLDRGCSADTLRTHVLIHPDPSGAPSGTAWCDPQSPPTWLATLLRADHLQRTQSLYDDLRNAVKTNTRIQWMDQVIDATSGVIGGLSTQDQDRFATALGEVLASMQRDHARLPGSGGSTGSAGSAGRAEGWDADSIGPQALFERAVRTAMGTSDKRAVGIEVISPAALAQSEGRSIAQMLAGEILGHFGGFFDENLRASDFDLGYQCALQWMGDGLPRCGLTAIQTSQAIASATGGYEVKELWRKWGETSLGQVASHHPMAMAGLLTQIGRVSVQDVLGIHHPHNPFRKDNTQASP
jgi:hypothetical protein